MSVGLCLGGVTKKGTMVCNLPLLFADGYPTCLDKITADQLEKFVPFMIRCSSGLNISEKLTAPEWWPNDLEFSIPLVKPPVVEAKWLKILKNLVSRCYTYHGCDFMLRFCTTLSQCPVKNLSFTTCWDGTTSLYNKATGKLLVTFRNENMCYDERKESPRENNFSKTSEESESSKADQSPMLNVYLCDKCEREFSTQKEINAHEEICLQQIQDQDSGPDTVRAESSLEQIQFLNYFRLANAQENELKDEKCIELPYRKRLLGSALRYSAVPFSSPLGVLVNKKSRAFHAMSSIHLDRVERYCCSKPVETSTRIREPRFSTWPVTWKPRKKSEEEEKQEDWVHIYKHPKRQWKRRTPYMQDEVRLKTLELIKQCRQVEVRVQKLTDNEIKYYTTPHASQKSCDFQKNPLNIMPNTNRRSTAEDEEIHIVSQTNYKVFCSMSLKNEVFSKKALYVNSNLGSTGSANILEPKPLSFERQLPPNTLYVYDKTALNIGGNQLENMSPDNSCIPVIDLMSSDDELDTFSRKEHFSALTQGYERIPDSTTFLSNEADVNMGECEIPPNVMTYSNEIPNYCSDYGKDLPELIKFLSSTTYQQSDETDDHILFTLDHRDSSNLILEKSFPRPMCDKSVQCTYDDFGQADDDYDDGDVDDCCLVKEVKTFPQTKLPKVFKNRREL